MRRVGIVSHDREVVLLALQREVHRQERLAFNTYSSQTMKDCHERIRVLTQEIARLRDGKEEG
jgi:hypothetical protein